MGVCWQCAVLLSHDRRLQLPIWEGEGKVQGEIQEEKKRKQKTQQQQKTQAKITFYKILTPVSHAFQLEKKIANLTVTVKDFE